MCQALRTGSERNCTEPAGRIEMIQTEGGWGRLDLTGAHWSLASQLNQLELARANNNASLGLFHDVLE